jgi:hypothetical protein
VARCVVALYRGGEETAMPDDLYQRDVFAWAAAQADALRRLGAGTRSNEIDWENVIEEIADVGNNRLDSVRSFLRLALTHAMKCAAWPESLSRRKWRNEILVFLDEARVRVTRSMLPAIDITDLHRKARRTVLNHRMPRPPRPLPETTDLTLDELLDESLDIDALIVRLGPPAGLTPGIAPAAPPHDMIPLEGR